MSTTIHGWPVIQTYGDPLLRNFKVPGTKRSLKLRKDVGPYLIAFAAEYHKLIAPIDVGTYDDWAYHPPRKGNASSKISDHSGGVAIDLNATKEGSQSKSNVWWVKHPLKAARMRVLLRKYRLLEWGGNYKNFYDPMHFTFRTYDPAAIKAEIKRLGITAAGGQKVAKQGIKQG
jgi:hypothetical protein